MSGKIHTDPLIEGGGFFDIFNKNATTTKPIIEDKELMQFIADKSVELVKDKSDMSSIDSQTIQIPYKVNNENIRTIVNNIININININNDLISKYQTQLKNIINKNSNITNRAFYNIILEEYEKQNKKNKNVNFDYSIEGHFVLFTSTENIDNNNTSEFKGYIEFNNKQIEKICFNVEPDITKQANEILGAITK
jgi:hypothetical protein